MVLLHYKKSDHNQFMMECPGNTPVTEVVDMVVECKFVIIVVNNMRIRLDIFACAVE
jgi:hypothetical protein